MTPRTAANALRRDVDRWLADGMDADQYDAFRAHVERIEAEAAAAALEEAIAAVEALPRTMTSAGDPREWPVSIDRSAVLEALRGTRA